MTRSPVTRRASTIGLDSSTRRFTPLTHRARAGQEVRYLSLQAETPLFRRQPGQLGQVEILQEHPLPSGGVLEALATVAVVAVLQELAQAHGRTVESGNAANRRTARFSLDKAVKSRGTSTVTRQPSSTRSTPLRSSTSGAGRPGGPPAGRPGRGCRPGRRHGRRRPDVDILGGNLRTTMAKMIGRRGLIDIRFDIRFAADNRFAAAGLPPGLGYRRGARL